MKTKILDCTLRDGGYYTLWDFSRDVVDEYVRATNILPIDYIEVGYRNNPSSSYLGKYGYTPVYELERLRGISKKKISVMLNEKSTSVDDLDRLLAPIKGLADMVRLAIDPANFDRAVRLAEAAKNMGFEVGFNTMYMSKWNEYDGFLGKLRSIDNVADLFCMVDSYGGVSPDEVREIFSTVRENTSCPVGFHGHNNLQLGLINTITAIDCGVDYVDATVLGMGRGAGNLNMELLLTYLNKHYGLNVDFNVLGDVISAFKPLYDTYQWGTSLPYMLSGANSLPQKNVMDWISNRTYSFNSIVRALDNKKSKVADNAKYPLLDEKKEYDTVIIVGGGPSAVEHADGIKNFIGKSANAAIVHATARNASAYIDVDMPQYYCLIGSEPKRLASNVKPSEYRGKCILPPYPRTMGTDVPVFAESSTFELEKIGFTSEYMDSCTALAIQTALNMCKGEIYVVGYDGYPGNVLSEKQVALTNENAALFESYERAAGRRLKSLTPTLYRQLEVSSVYQFI